MATVPLSGTQIALYSGIPFYNDYKHTRWFNSINDQLNWFAAQTHVTTISQANFQRAEGKGAILRVNMSVDELWNVNYMSFQNADYAKVFYGFVTEIEYVQNKTTYIHFEIDVLQTWRFDMDFKPSFVAREHCPLWNTDGSPVINTVPEDVNYGTEYDNVYVNEFLATGVKWLVILAKQTLHAQTNGIGVSFPAGTIVPTVIGTPQPLSVYVLPFLDNDSCPGVILSDGTTVNLTKPSVLLRGLCIADKSVNAIVSMYVTDYTGIACTYDGSNVTFSTNNNEILGASIQGTDPVTGSTETYTCLYAQSVWTFGSQDNLIEAKYASYKTVTESKLLMYPYTQLVLDDFKGNRAVFKNEYINNFNLYITSKGSLGSSNKTSYGIVDYNYSDENLSFRDKVSDESALINSDPNDVPILDSNLAAFLQGNRNTINNQKNTINWNAGMGIAGGALGAVSSAASGNLTGVGASLLGTVKGAGNNALQLQGILAKQQDIANTPPQLAKMGSNSSYTVGNGYNGVFIIKKQIKDEYIKKLTDYFNMYGYKKNEVKIPNFNTRQYWNYVQTVGCVIRASINNEDLEELKSVFDNGITLWHTDDIGNYTLSNEVVA